MHKLKRIFLRAPKRSVFAALSIALLAHMLYLGMGVIRQFDDRRWDIPAGVYAAPLELYAGLAINAPTLSETLDQLGFQRVDGVTRPGQYSATPERISLWTRPFRFWDRLDPAERYNLQFDNDRLLSLESADRQRVSLLRLEPLRLGSIFATHHEDRLLVEPDAIIWRFNTGSDFTEKSAQCEQV